MNVLFIGYQSNKYSFNIWYNSDFPILEKQKIV